MELKTSGQEKEKNIKIPGNNISSGSDSQTLLSQNDKVSTKI
jgi:hypothetical protein